MKHNLIDTLLENFLADDKKVGIHSNHNKAMEKIVNN